MKKTKKSKFLSLVLCGAMIFSTFAFLPMQVNAADEKNQTEATEQTDAAAAKDADTQTESKAQDSAKEQTKASVGNAQAGTVQKNAAKAIAGKAASKTVDFTNAAPLLAPVTGKTTAAKKAKAAKAANDSKSSDMVDNEGVITSKTATKLDDGSYKIRLESYVTGATTTTTVTEDVPTDIVLVLDQSGSMAENFGSDSHDEVYELDQSKTYYVKGRSGYDKVTWCTTCQAWTNGCRNRFITGEHYRGTLYTPKSSVNSSGTQFFEYHEAITKLQALQDAANSFVNEVARKAKGSDGKTIVDHRIAVVGYAGSASDLTSGFQKMSTDAGKDTVTNAINGLSADGGTMIDEGLATANTIFSKNPISQDQKRNRVVIVFTDGAPGSYGDWAKESVTTANNAIKAAKTSKETYKATVYSVGIFEGADASQPSSLPEYTAPGRWNSVSSEDQIKNSNRFMHLISSNYPNASDINTPGTINANLNGKSYYLSASNSAALNDIFQQISNQIESGGASVKLDSSTVVKDIVSDYFQLPVGVTADDITLKTADFDGYASDNKTAKWKTETTAGEGVHAEIDDNTVKVNGFDFAANYVGIDKNNGIETARGKKLIIEFNVKPKDRFLGGNAVPTNGKDSGIYTVKDGTETVVENFQQPTVNVPIKEITVEAADQNVYLTGSAHINEIKGNITVSAGNITLDLSKDNYGLEAWQNAYVDLTVSAKDSSGKDIFASKYSGMSNLTDDTVYNVNAEIKAKGAEEGNTASATGNINVFKPELTYKDSTVYYGDTAPTSYDGNKVGGTVWKHGNKASTDDDVTMTGIAPVLALTYSPAIGSEPYYKYGKIAIKQDIPVQATVKIGKTDVTRFVAFNHQECSPSCGFDPANEQFLIHVKTCSLTVTKSGGVTGEPYVMNIYKDGELYTSMTIVGNGSETIRELPVGTYTVQEDTKWAWRYKDPEPEISSGVSLKKGNTSGTITVMNHDRYQSFLNGYSTVVKNVYNSAK